MGELKFIGKRVVNLIVMLLGVAKIGRASCRERV